MVSDLRKSGKGAITIQRIHAVLRAALTGARKWHVVFEPKLVVRESTAGTNER